jgi:hypothetical protein
MRVLRFGNTGSDIQEWQNFLIGKKYNLFETGVFDAKTLASTIEFQIKNGLSSDGVVGPKTYAVALQQGLGVVTDEHPDGLDKPLKPFGIEALTDIQKEQLFGKFSYIPEPVKDNPEAIKIIDGWDAQNIIGVTVPQICNLLGKPAYKVWVHKSVAKQLISVFQAWEDAGLIHFVLTWAGCWNARFKRGSTTSLSNHSWGSAFDINVTWNPLGATPAMWDEKGSVRELVEIALQYGWFWGGFFKSRKDGQHFEAYKIL